VLLDTSLALREAGRVVRRVEGTVSQHFTDQHETGVATCPANETTTHWLCSARPAVVVEPYAADMLDELTEKDVRPRSISTRSVSKELLDA